MQKTYLNVPYAQKDAAKALGAKWDATQKKWYVPADKDVALFAQWQTDAPPVASKPAAAAGKSVALSSGVTTYPSDPNFVAYSGAEPPWQ
ncbi:hypothetical protein JCM14076_19410 [Methylosoma difficile]